MSLGSRAAFAGRGPAPLGLPPGGQRGQGASAGERAFTLVELLVVLAIALSALAVVGPDVFRSVAKTRVAAEEATISQAATLVGVRAFLRHTPATIQCREREVTVNGGNRITFEHLSFPEQAVSYNSNGLATPRTLRYLVEGEEAERTVEIP